MAVIQLVLSYQIEFKEPISTISKQFAFVVFALALIRLILSIGRLHDLNFSGWYSLLTFVPIVNIVLELILWFKDGTPGTNRFGKDPKNRIGKAYDNKMKMLKDSLDLGLITHEQYNVKKEELDKEIQLFEEKEAKVVSDYNNEKINKDKINKLQSLLNSGLISEEEFLTKRKDIYLENNKPPVVFPHEPKKMNILDKSVIAIVVATVIYIVFSSI